MTKRAMIRAAQQAVAAAFPQVLLVQGKGYVYISSDDSTMLEYIAGLYTSSIPVCYIWQQTPEQWVADVRYLMESEIIDRYY